MSGSAMALTDLLHVGRLGGLTSVSGLRTRKSCGFFAPVQNGRDEKAQYKTRKGNKPRRLTAVSESRLCLSQGRFTKNCKEAFMPSPYLSRALELQDEHSRILTQLIGLTSYLMTAQGDAEFLGNDYHAIFWLYLDRLNELEVIQQEIFQCVRKAAAVAKEESS